MERKYNKELLNYAKELRANPTKEERKLWYEFLQNYPIKFLRQKIIGNYIVDFYCARAKLIIELDGSQHYVEGALEYDDSRTAYLNRYGLEILRIQNTDVNKNFQAVCQYIDLTVKNRIQ